MKDNLQTDRQTPTHPPTTHRHTHTHTHTFHVKSFKFFNECHLYVLHFFEIFTSARKKS